MEELACVACGAVFEDDDPDRFEDGIVLCPECDDEPVDWGLEPHSEVVAYLE